MSFYLSYLFRNTLCALRRFKTSASFTSPMVIYSAINQHSIGRVNHYLVPHVNVPFRSSPIFALSVLGWLGLEKPAEKIEDDLIKNIKWGILLMQRKDYKKSERMFHIALRMAQQVQNQQAVTYIYDCMANLNMETAQYDKAIKLFKSVMERLLGSGYNENHIKNVHISLKIARCYHLNGDIEKAGIGYRWALDHLKNDKTDRLEPVTKLIAIAEDWYGHYLLEQNKLQQGVTSMLNAYNMLKQLNDEDDAEEIICLVNDLGAAYEMMGDLEMAEEYLKEAIRITRKLSDDVVLLSTIYVNLGRLLIRKGVTDTAEKCCKKAMKLAKSVNSKECYQEANQCLEELKKIKIIK